MDQVRSDLAPERAEVPVRPAPAPVRPPPSAPPPVRRRPWLRRLLLVVALLVVIVVLWRVVWPWVAGSGHHAPPAQPAQPVGVARIGTGTMQVVLTGLGTVTPLATVTVQTQISGQLMSVGFKEGQLVHKGDFLAQIDPRPYQVALEQAQGTLAHDTALLAQARSDLARYRQLNRQDSIARQQVADQEFLAQQDQGLVAEDQASVDNARLNLTYCHIVSPVDGRVGLRLVDPGNYVQTSSATGLVVVTQLQPISVIFVLPEDNIPDLSRQMHAGDTLGVGAYDRTDATLLDTGTLITVDNTVDTTTGTVKLRASFPNADDALFPNQFVNARLLLKTLDNVVEAPSAAIQHGAPGTFVYLLKPDSTVGVQVVKTGVTDGDKVQITSGLKAGNMVVVDGTDRLRDGAKVSVQPDKGDDAANATPADAPQPATTPAHHHHHHQAGQKGQTGQQSQAGEQSQAGQ